MKHILIYRRNYYNILAAGNPGNVENLALDCRQATDDYQCLLSLGRRKGYTSFLMQNGHTNYHGENAGVVSICDRYALQTFK